MPRLPTMFFMYVSVCSSSLELGYYEFASHKRTYGESESITQSSLPEVFGGVFQRRNRDLYKCAGELLIEKEELENPEFLSDCTKKLLSICNRTSHGIFFSCFWMSRN